MAQKETQVAIRRRQVAQLALSYVPQYVIAERLGVSTATVSRDMQAIRSEWREDAKADVQAILMREVQSLDRLESQLWGVFVASNTATEDRLRTANTILRCKERRAKYYGFDQPDLIDITVSADVAREVLEAKVIELEAQLDDDSQ